MPNKLLIEDVRKYVKPEGLSLLIKIKFIDFVRTVNYYKKTPFENDSC